MMVWLVPAALVGLLGTAMPIAVHLLVRHRAHQIPFPTLRFLRQSASASVRLRWLQDPWLLLVRVAIIAAAAAALAQPLLLTPGRVNAWSDRTVRAIVVDTSRSMNAPNAAEANTWTRQHADREAARSYQSDRIDTSDINAGIAQAVFALTAAPPARREIVVISDFQAGTIGKESFRSVPASVGVRLVRVGSAQETVQIPGRPIWSEIGGHIEARAPLIGLRGNASWVTFTRSDPNAPNQPLAIHLAVDPSSRRAAAAALRAVLAVGAPAAAAGTPLFVLALRGAPELRPLLQAAEYPRDTRDGEFLHRLLTDAALTEAAAALPEGRDFGPAWVPVARARDGRPALAATTIDPARIGVKATGRQQGAERHAVAIASVAGAHDITTALVMRAAMHAAADVADLDESEIVTIDDQRLRSWERPAQPPTADAVRHTDRSDARWCWLAVLALVGLEDVIRRRADAPAQEVERARAA